MQTHKCPAEQASILGPTATHKLALMHTHTQALIHKRPQVAAGSSAELLASLPGTGDADKLRAAVDAIFQLGRAADELRAQNHALGQDLVHISQQQQQQQKREFEQKSEQREHQLQSPGECQAVCSIANFECLIAKSGCLIASRPFVKNLWSFLGANQAYIIVKDGRAEAMS